MNSETATSYYRPLLDWLCMHIDQKQANIKVPCSYRCFLNKWMAYDISVWRALRLFSLIYLLTEYILRELIIFMEPIKSTCWYFINKSTMASIVIRSRLALKIHVCFCRRLTADVIAFDVYDSIKAKKCHASTNKCRVVCTVRPYRAVIKGIGDDSVLCIADARVSAVRNPSTVCIIHCYPLPLDSTFVTEAVNLSSACL